jgi:hypothetical protein
LLTDGSSVEQLPPDVAIGNGSDHASAGILGKQDPKHVGVEPPKRFFDRFGLSDGNERPIQFFGSKRADPASLRGNPPRSGSTRPVAYS